MHCFFKGLSRSSHVSNTQRAAAHRPRSRRTAQRLESNRLRARRARDSAIRWGPDQIRPSTLEEWLRTAGSRPLNTAAGPTKTTGSDHELRDDEELARDGREVGRAANDQGLTSYGRSRRSPCPSTASRRRQSNKKVATLRTSSGLQAIWEGPDALDKLFEIEGYGMPVIVAYLGRGRRSPEHVQGVRRRVGEPAAMPEDPPDDGPMSPSRGPGPRCCRGSWTSTGTTRWLAKVVAPKGRRAGHSSPPLSPRRGGWYERP